MLSPTSTSNARSDVDLDSARISIIPTGDSLAREEKRILAEIVGAMETHVRDDALVVFGNVAGQSWG